MSKPLETGNRYGKWTVGELIVRPGSRGAYYELTCDCGTKKVMRMSIVRCGYSTQCFACKGTSQRGKSYIRRQKPLPEERTCNTCAIVRPIGDYYRVNQKIVTPVKTYRYKTTWTICKFCCRKKAANKARERKMNV